MSEYEPGTVAMVTHNGKRMRAMRGDSSWLVACCAFTDEVSDITPLVCIEATREDADRLTSIPNRFLSDGERALVRDIAAAIRDQLPEETQRWVVKDGLLLWDTARRSGQNLATFHQATDAQAVADMLNAAEGVA